MEESSSGAIVPLVKQELSQAMPSTSSLQPSRTPSPGSSLPVTRMSASGATATTGKVMEVDRDFLCPICMQVIKDPFLTACGHSFCYMCITTHLRNKSDCPFCTSHLTSSNLFPNCLLQKVLKKASARQMSINASPIEQFRLALHQGCDVSLKELDTLLLLLGEKKKKMEQEESEKNMQILLDFLQYLKKQKIDELNEVRNDLQLIKEDIDAVERHRIDLYRARDRYSMKLRMLHDDPSTRCPWPASDRNNSGCVSNSFSAGKASGSLLSKKLDGKTIINSHGLQRKDSVSEDSQYSQPGVSSGKKRRIHVQFDDLQECYLHKRRQSATQMPAQQEKDKSITQREGYNSGLKDFQCVLNTVSQYSRLRVVAELRHGDMFHTPNIVSSIEFDRDDELFATAGVSRQIKVFDFASVFNESTDVHCPVVEISTRSKLSCLSWNKFAKNQIASSDYEGIVTVWDVTTRQSVMECEEHEKRAWSVDFCRTEPSMLVSGSDDCKVKIWCTNQEASVMSIDIKANICCVKYNPGSSNHIAVGSADHHIHYYDLRNTSQPLYVFSGHRKTVSYVKFLSNNELASASTDSTLRLWNVRDNLAVRTFKGHTNEKNFVGLTVNNEYIACGSETNDVFVYHKEISKAVMWHRFGSPEMGGADEENGPYFISAICWKSDSPTMLTANSQGMIKVLTMVA